MSLNVIISSRLLVFVLSGFVAAQSSLRAQELAHLSATVTVPAEASQTAFGDVVALDGETAIIGAPDDDRHLAAIYGWVLDPATHQFGSATVYVKTPDGWVLQSVLRPSITQMGASFGAAVAVRGDWAMVGAPFEGVERPDAPIYNGAVYVFHRVGTTWTQTARLDVADDPEAQDALFGSAISMDGDMAIIGAPGEHQSQLGRPRRNGTAYVYQLKGEVWTKQARLVGTNPFLRSSFGNTVSISHDVAVVGSTGVTGGAAYVFMKQGTDWRADGTLLSKLGGRHSGFGSCVSVHAGTIAVGAPGERRDLSAAQTSHTLDEGVVYLFTRNTGRWVLQQRLNSPYKVAGGAFGQKVALNGGALLVGAGEIVSNDDGVILSSGAAYLFYRDRSAWMLASRMPQHGDPNPLNFGSAVALDDHTALIGAPGQQMAPESDDVTVPWTRLPGSALWYEVPVWSEVISAAGAGDCFHHRPMRVDAQTGMVCQVLDYENMSCATLPGLRLSISGLAGGVTVLGAQPGSSSGNALVYYTNAIVPGEKVNFTLTYCDPSRRTSTTVQPVIRAEPLLESIAAPGPVAGTLAKMRGVRDSAQGPVLEWDSVANARYVVEYSADGRTWYRAVHQLRSIGARLMWVDRGQPETQSAPASKAMRQYRVKRVP